MITIYSKPKCTQCDFTKKFLTERNVPFEIKDVTENEVFLNEVREMGFSSLPVVVSGKIEPFSGFAPDKLEQLV